MRDIELVKRAASRACGVYLIHTKIAFCEAQVLCAHTGDQNSRAWLHVVAGGLVVLEKQGVDIGTDLSGAPRRTQNRVLQVAKASYIDCLLGVVQRGRPPDMTRSPEVLRCGAKNFKTPRQQRQHPENGRGRQARGHFLLKFSWVCG